MGYEEKKGYCSACDKKRMLRRKEINHILHLLLSILTMGIWLVKWGMTAMRSSMCWYCSEYGKKLSSVAFLNKKLF